MQLNADFSQRANAIVEGEKAALAPATSSPTGLKPPVGTGGASWIGWTAAVPSTTPTEVPTERQPPSLSRSPGSLVIIGISAVYGLFSGLLNARALRLLKLQ